MLRAQDDASELYNRYRPMTLNELRGQNGVATSLLQLRKDDNLPHAILLTGQSGCGKTTLARIIARMWQCKERDFHEINTADFRGIETIRDIRRKLGIVTGPAKFYLIDEAHQITGPAQDAMLKMLEEPPSHVYFILATTDPQKLIRTIHTRCMEFQLKQLQPLDAKKLIEEVAEFEEWDIDDDVVDKLIQEGEGSGRQILVLMQKAMTHENVKDQILAIEDANYKADAGDLARLLVDATKKPVWKKIAKTIDVVLAKGEPEQVRRVVLGYSAKVLLSSGDTPKGRQALSVIQAFEEPTYHSGKAGLVRACFEAAFGLDD